MQDDSRDFQVPASDQKGHSVRKSVRISPQLDMQIDLILGSRKFPYRTEGELLRHAVMKHCRWLLSMQDDIQSLMPQIETMMEMVRMEEEQRQFSEVVEKIVKEATSLAAEGHVRKARSLVDKAMTQAGKIPDRYWREKYSREITTKLGHLTSRPANLSPQEMTEDREGEREDEH